ncbi:hypothetical protein K3172_01590 [Qipengyuania sp. 6B39]|uniref:Calx-beta domain-containing protein n=1 Tax=Qipengyuania proteolytica TaxID=2867239 RepID=UPI001C8AB950|nr:Calx-beta domain-containing protein [Qipengyuania proteolytica]MBX7494543.1 hypothetical protein [Qipengyuania proteolytica]
MKRFGKEKGLHRLMLGAATIALAVPLLANAQSSSEAYTYDALGRLIEVKTSGGVNNNETRSLCYDDAGNRTSYVSRSDGAASGCVNTGEGSPIPTPTPTPTPTPAPSISVGDASAPEGGVLVFTVSLSSAYSSSIGVAYATAYGSAGSADIYPASGTLSFAAGQTSQTVSVYSKQDIRVEANETFTLNLSSPTGGATISDGQGVGTITDDDDVGEPTCGEFVC